MTRSIFSTDESEGISRNLAYAMASQGIGLLSSVVMSLVVPKFLGVEDYAYWQLFLLYSSYTGLALLGVNDGMYLRLGGKRYSELNYSELKAQVLAVSAFQVVVGAACLVTVLLTGFETEQLFVFVAVAVFGFVANMTGFLRYVFQSTNLTRISSVADTITKVSFLVCVVGILLAGGATSSPFIMLSNSLRNG